MEMIGLIVLVYAHVGLIDLNCKFYPNCEISCSRCAPSEALCASNQQDYVFLDGEVSQVFGSSHSLDFLLGV